MKQIFYITFLSLLAFTACNDKYEFSSSGFSSPGVISGPAQITVDPESTQTVVLSWEASVVDDDTWVLYDVIFDHADGNFSNPFSTIKSDGGTQNKLTLTQAAVNTIAREGGINPTESGSFIWTVRAYRGGTIKYAPESKSISITRPDVLDVPEQLYIFGTALADTENGVQMGKPASGIFLFHTTIALSGNLWFCSSPDPDAKGALRYYYDDAANKLMQGEGTTAVTANEYAVDITVNFPARSFSAEAPFEAPEELYIQGPVAEAGQKFRKEATDTFVLYTKFGSAGSIYFTSTQNADAVDAKQYYIAGGKLEFGGGTTAVNATQYTADRITVNTTARTMTIEPIGDIILEWVNAMVPVDAANPSFSYASDGNFTLTFNIPVNFQHVDEENKGGNCYTDARYILKVNENPAVPMPSNDEIKNTPAADRKIKRWGCKYINEADNGNPYNLTIQPYDRPAAPPTHADIWIPVFETGRHNDADVDTEEIVASPYYVYSEMPSRWHANWFFKTAWAGSQRTATIYTNKNNKIGVHIE